jgi:hypothetical protein
MTNIVLGTSELEGSLIEGNHSERGKDLNPRRSPYLDPADLKTCEDDANGPIIDSSVIVEKPHSAHLWKGQSHHLKPHLDNLERIAAAVNQRH